MKRKYVISLLLAGAMLLGGANLHAAFNYYDLHGNTIAITPSDSLIVIAFKPGGLAGPVRNEDVRTAGPAISAQRPVPRGSCVGI